MATCVGRLKGLPPWRVAGVSGSPMTRRHLPSGVNFRTVWWRSSVSHTMPSASMVMPWARRTCPSPHERRNLPSRSKTMTGCSPRVKQKTLSLASTATPATSTKCQPSGSLPQPSTTLKFMLAGLLEGLVHALEAPAQGLAGLLVGDDIEPVGLDGAQHAPRHVLRLEVTADELEPVVVLGPFGILQVRGTVALARADVRAHAHRTEDRHADAVGAQVLVESLAEPHHGVLARVVDAEALGGDEPGHGCGIDDVAGLLLGDQARDEGLHAVDDAPQVDREHPFPVAMGGGFQAAVYGHPGIVADDVCAAHLRPRALGEGLHGGQLRHVGLDGEGLGPRLLHPRRRLGHARFVDVRHHDLGALAREGEAERAPDTAGAARHHHRLALEIFHVLSRRWTR